MAQIKGYRRADGTWVKPHSRTMGRRISRKLTRGRHTYDARLKGYRQASAKRKRHQLRQENIRRRKIQRLNASTPNDLVITAMIRDVRSVSKKVHKGRRRRGEEALAHARIKLLRASVPKKQVVRV